jgi:indoleamine 2,3-dioxygenase
MGERVDTLDIERYDVGPSRGFLPDAPPLSSFPAAAPDSLHRLDDLADALPARLADGDLRRTLRDLSVPPDGTLDGLSERELLRTYVVTGFLANAYVHADDGPPAHALPAGVAVPLHGAATRLDRTPVLSYDAFVLHNWTLADPDAGLTPENVRTLVAFTDLRDEEWFVAVHVAVERAAGAGLAAVGDAQQAVVDDDPAAATHALGTLADSLDGVLAAHDRMPEQNDPERYANGFRPYLGGLDGVVYEGVPALDGSRSFHGASAAQSSVLPAVDAALGVDHGDNPLVGRLHALRRDMPPAHRAFVEVAAAGPSVGAFAAASGDAALRDAYNDCIDLLVTLREHHFEIVKRYLGGESDDTGTAGIPYGRFLDSFVDDTRDARL